MGGSVVVDLCKGVGVADLHGWINGGRDKQYWVPRVYRSGRGMNRVLAYRRKRSGSLCV